MTRDDARDARLMRARMRTGPADGVAPTVFVPIMLRLQIGLRAKDVAYARWGVVKLDKEDPRLLWVRVLPHAWGWLLLGLWHVFAWWRVRFAIMSLVPRGVRIQVRPW